MTGENLKEADSDSSGGLLAIENPDLSGSFQEAENTEHRHTSEVANELSRQTDTSGLIENDEKESGPDPGSEVWQPVDHGLLCWLQVIGSFGIWTNSWGLVNAFGEFQAYYETIPSQSPSQIAWIGSTKPPCTRILSLVLTRQFFAGIQSFLLLITGLMSGRLFDRGYYCHMRCLGNFLIVLGMMMTR